MERLDELRRALEQHAVRVMGPRSPYWQCSYCQALQTTPISFPHKPDCLLAPIAEPPGEYLDQLPAILVALDLIVKIYDYGKSAGVHYACNPIGRPEAPHRLIVYIAGQRDRQFDGATFGEAFRSCYDFLREPPAARGATEYDSWIEDFADMAGGGADLGRPGFYNLQTPHSGLTDPPLSAEDRAGYHWPNETRWGCVPSRARAHEEAGQ